LLHRRQRIALARRLILAVSYEANVVAGNLEVLKVHRN